MKRYFFCFIILLCSEAGFTQGLNKPQKVTDSLMQRFASEKKDSAKAVVAFDLVKRLARIDSIKSYEYLEKGKQHIGNSVYLEGLYHFSVAQYYFDTDRDRCNEALMKAIAVLTKIKTKDSFKLQAKAWFNYVVQNQRTKGDDFAVGTIPKKSIPLVEKASASVAANGISKRNSKLFVGRSRNVTKPATMKNAEEPASVFCSFPMVYFPTGTFFPKKAAVGSAKAMVSTGI